MRQRNHRCRIPIPLFLRGGGDLPGNRVYGNTANHELLSREVLPEVPPRVEYELTDLGLSLLEPMRNLDQRIGSKWDSIKKARVGFDSRTVK